MTLRTQKIELNPNNKQSTLMSQHAGYARVAFNFALSAFKAGLDKDEWRTLPYRFLGNYDSARFYSGMESLDFVKAL